MKYTHIFYIQKETECINQKTIKFVIRKELWRVRRVRLNEVKKNKRE
jgi:hypothetical protein